MFDRIKQYFNKNMVLRVQQPPQNYLLQFSNADSSNKSAYSSLSYVCYAYNHEIETVAKDIKRTIEVLPNMAHFPTLFEKLSVQNRTFLNQQCIPVLTLDQKSPRQYVGLRSHMIKQDPVQKIHHSLPSHISSTKEFPGLFVSCRYDQNQHSCHFIAKTMTIDAMRMNQETDKNLFFKV